MKVALEPSGDSCIRWVRPCKEGGLHRRMKTSPPLTGASEAWRRSDKSEVENASQSASQPKPVRRWGRFSLHRLSSSMSVCCSLLAIHFSPNPPHPPPSAYVCLTSQICYHTEEVKKAIPPCTALRHYQKGSPQKLVYGRLFFRADHAGSATSPLPIGAN